jgi:hypothetical protein
MRLVSAVRNDEAQTADSACERRREMSADEACGRVSMFFAMNNSLIDESKYREGEERRRQLE